MIRQTGETAGHSIGPPRSHDSHLSMLVTFSNRYAFRQKKLLHQLFFYKRHIRKNGASERNFQEVSYIFAQLK